MYTKKKTKFAKTNISSKDDEWLRDLFLSSRPEHVPIKIAWESKEVTGLFVTDEEVTFNKSFLEKGMMSCHNCQNIMSVDDAFCHKCKADRFILVHRLKEKVKV